MSEFSSQIFLGCLSFPDLEGAAFSRFGVTWVPEVFSHVRRGVFHVDHFLRLNRNWKPRMKSLWHPDVDLGEGGVSRFGGTEFWGLRSEFSRHPFLLCM